MSTFEFADSMSFLLNSTPLIGRRVSGSTWGVNLPSVSPLPPPSQAEDSLAKIGLICLEHITKARRGLTVRELTRKSAPLKALPEKTKQEMLQELESAGLIEIQETTSRSGRGSKRVAWVAVEKDE